MKRKQRIFIGISIAIIALTCGGLYVNYQLDRLVRSLSLPGLLFITAETEDPSIPGIETPSGEPGMPGPAGAVSPSGNGRPGLSQSSSGTSAGNLNPHQEIANEVQNKVNRPIDKEDLISAGLIIIRRLSSEEIRFLYQVGKKDDYSLEELKKTREILLAKLSASDIETLREIGRRYGRELKILDASVKLQP